MRRELSKAVRDEFVARFGRAMPQFRPLKGQKIGPSCYPYAWPVAPDLTFFVMLQVSTKAFEEFTVELAFSQDGRFPDDLLAGLPFDYAEAGVRSIASRPAGRLNLGHLWDRRGNTLDYWWEVTPRPSPREMAQRLKDLAATGKMAEVPLDEALRRVGPAVADAIGKLSELGLPLFREVARHRGIEKPA